MGMNKLYVVHFADDEPEFFHDEGDGRGYEAALAAAQDALDEMFDPQTLQYGDDVDKVYVAEVVAMSTEVDRTDRPPQEELDEEGFDQDGLDWSDGQEYICSYGLAVLRDCDPRSAKCPRVH